MSRAEMYVNTTDLPKKVASEILPIFKNLIKWKEGCKILDVGCGPGDVTHDILLPNLPQSTSEIIGIDKCAEFIDYANLHYDSNPICSFKVLDIVNDEVHKEFVHHFDYVVSFLCLHQFNNHEAAFTNIKKMLKPGGEMVCYFATTSKSFDVYKSLASLEKWKPYLHDYEKYCSPYKDSLNPKEDIERFLRDMGFKVAFLKLEERKHKFLLSTSPKYFQTLCPLPIPDEIKNLLEVSTFDVLKSLNLLKLTENNEEYFDFSCTLAIMHIIMGS
ncbi:hypothetical protein RI129_009157 [Pyrocoelia pectoralis]|uniref:Methyltransferase domain-containing protein n=1 Tax=Pyrocoelia pectoralis TaxID=417401 RepID=A0AAN7V6X5_9COLE